MSEEQNVAEKVVDTTMPDGRWKFDESVTAAFDDMLRRSIPQYDVMRAAVLAMGRPLVKHDTDIVDLGCSRGEALAPFVSAFGAYNRFVGIEVSEPMLAVARERFKGYISSGLADIRKLDLREKYPPVKASLTLSVFTMQFVPIEHRQRVFQDVYDHTIPGGGFILVEKVLGETSKIDKMLVENYYQLKADNGYSQDAIERKRLSLEGVLVPVTAAWNAELLRQAGFRQVDCFWAWMNFRGFVAIR
jgi:tRNA (cmo5U34)-methyltransferase